MKGELTVVAAVIWRQGRYLAVGRPRGKSHEGFWEFPGGKVEEGESLKEALARELAEELGIVAERFDFRCEKRHAYPEFSVRLHFFDVHAHQGEPYPKEGQPMRWLDPALAVREVFLPADRDIVDELAAGS